MKEQLEIVTRVSPRDEDYRESLFHVVLRTGSVLPSFALLAIASCVIGKYVFLIPLEQLGVVAAVPCVVGFGITRVLNLLIPKPPPRSNTELTRPSLVFRVFVIVAFVAAFIATDFFLSAMLYYALHLRSIVNGTLRIAAACAVLAGGISLLALIREVMSEFVNTFAIAAVKLLMYPTRIADFLRGHGWHKSARWS